MAAIVVGEEPYSIDPAVSEWGNPRVVRHGSCRKDDRKVVIAIRGVPSELKHLSKVRKRKQL